MQNEKFINPKYKHSKPTSRIIEAFYDVYNTLRYGFLEKVYENALTLELIKRDHSVDQQTPIEVYFDGMVVGKYFADMLVDKLILIEIKAARTLDKSHQAQLLNYLKATNVEVGLLLNFGPKPQVTRKIN